MGMLQLEGAVSGFGKGMGQGLQTMQNTMSQSMLMEERNKFELARLRETFGHERGLLSERHKQDLERDDTKYSRDLDMKDQEHDFQAGQNRITREADRQKADADAERRKELEDVKYKNEINKLVVEKGFSQQEAAQKVKEDRAKEERERKDKREDRQHMTGERITLKSMELQEAEKRGRAGSTKEDHHGQDSKVKAIESTLKMRLAELDSINLSEKREAEIRREIKDLEKERNELLGIKGGYRERPPIRMPQ